MNSPHFFDTLNTFEGLKERARLALTNTEVFYRELNEAHWPDELLKVKKKIGVWQMPWIKETIKGLDKCVTERELFNISAQLFQYQRDMFTVWEIIKPFFKYSEEYGVYILKEGYSWFPFAIRQETTEHALMSVAGDIINRVRTLLDTIEERREFKIRDIEEAAKRAGYEGTLRQLRQQLVNWNNWNGGERDKKEWVLSGSELDDFLNRFLLPRKRRRKT